MKHNERLQTEQLAINAVHQNRTDDLDLDKIAKAFIEVNSRRMKYFGKVV